MKYFVYVLIAGVLLIGRGAQVLFALKKTPETKKYGNNPKLAVAVMSAIGVVLLAIGIIGIVPKGKSNQTAAPSARMTFTQFQSAFNMHLNELLSEEIKTWSIHDGEKADTARFNSDGYSVLAMLSNDEHHYVDGTVYIFELRDDDDFFTTNYYRMCALVLVFEPITSLDAASKILTELYDAGKEGITYGSGAKYNFQSVAGNGILTINLRH